jgi:hypothetical protein
VMYATSQNSQSAMVKDSYWKKQLIKISRHIISSFQS